MDKAVCAKYIADESGDRSETVRCSVAQMRQRLRLAKIYPDDLKTQYTPPDRACHFGQGCKRYDLQFVTHVLSNFFLDNIGNSKSV